MNNPIKQIILKPDKSPIPKGAKPFLKFVAKISENPSAYAAQIEQESFWNPRAKSWAGARGLSQMMPTTGKWLARTHCKHLGGFRPFSPNWSLRCGAIYMKLLSNNQRYSAGKYCQNKAIALQRYNGGIHIHRELRRAKSANNTYSIRGARRACRRAKWACKENYQYPIRIFKKQAKYTKIGMLGKTCNEVI